MRWARPAYRQVLGEAEGGADDGFEGLGFVEQGDFHAEKENGNIAGGKGGKRTESFSVVMRARPRRARVRVRAFSTSGTEKRWWSAKVRW